MVTGQEIRKAYGGFSHLQFIYNSYQLLLYRWSCQVYYLFKEQ